MHKHLKAELVAPDHVNPKLSAGISEVIEMMMAKDPRRRYQSCKDLLVDLRAIRKGETPPLAHKDVLPASDLASLAAAEASAMSEMAVDASVEGRPLVREPLVITLAIVAAVSILVNILQFLG
jgi:hypothetical protein